MNLNTQYSRPSFFKPNVENLRVYFNPVVIVKALVREIRRTPQVFGCLAWCTHPDVLTAMEEVDTAIIMTKTQVQSLEEKHSRQVYRQGPRVQGFADASQVFGGRDRRGTRMGGVRIFQRDQGCHEQSGEHDDRQRPRSGELLKSTSGWPPAKKKRKRKT